MTRTLWTMSELLASTGGRLDLPPHGTRGAGLQAPCMTDVGPAGTGATGISIDTRTLAPGELFVPLTDARDGHDFVTAAFGLGAAASLVRSDYARKPGDGALIRVDDPLRALERVGIAARARLSPTARVIAVTGSAGKTGTKEMLRACLKVCASSPDKVHAPEKSFNNHWGVPLTLARMPADTEFAVFEIGMNHAGEIRPLSKMVRPHIAIVTNVLPVHVGNFPEGEEGVAAAKAEIFEGLEAPLQTAPTGNQFSAPTCGEADVGHGKAESSSARGGRPRGGTAIILRNSPHFQTLRSAASDAGATILSFGGADADLVLRSVETGTDALRTGQHIRAAFSQQAKTGLQQFRTGLQQFRTGGELEFEMGMRGEHLATNALAVMLALCVLGCDAELASGALARVEAAAGRGARQRLTGAQGHMLLIDESYNANPASMRAALANLTAVADADAARRIAVMGDMLELGADSASYHKDLQPAAARADLIFACGPNMRHLFDALPAEKRGAWAANSAELIEPVLAALLPGDAVMIKGSLGSRMAPIVDAIKKRFANG